MEKYISRDEVLKAFKLRVSNPNKDYQRGMQDAIDMLIPDVLEKIPDVDVQPVRRGRWKLTDNPSFRKCSECGAWWSSDITDNYFTKYCPKCGAKMDLKDGDTNG